MEAERDDLFAKEALILERAKAALRAEGLPPEAKLAELSSLLCHYEKLLRQASRLTRMGDGYQHKMLLAYEEIERHRHELTEHKRQLELRNRLILGTFGRYLSDEVVTRLLEAPEGLALGGEKRTVSIMMADLRGFSALADGIDPQDVVALLNGYLEAMTGIIMKWGGTIDEFIGDAILVLFGAPLLHTDDHVRAAACALQMQREMPAVNAMNAAKGLPAVEMGIGVHTGEVVVGNIGSLQRAKYGVVGRAVNFASRVESYSVGGQVLVSQALRDALGPLGEFGEELDVHPKGMQPVTIHELVGVGGDIDIRLERRVVERAALRTEVAIRFVVVEGKDARGSERSGALVAASTDLQEAEIRSTEGVRPFSNIRARLECAPETDVYAKVLGGPARHGGFIVRFTVLPEVARQAIAAASA